MKYLNWASLTEDIMECLVLNQTQLAEKCDVSQQSVSNWRSGFRSPGVYARSIIRNLAVEANLDVEDYRLAPYQKKRTGSATGYQPSVPEDIMAFAQRLAALPKRQREKVIDLAEFMISRG